MAIYLVVDRVIEEPRATRLIRAETRAQVLAHIAQEFDIKVATAEDVDILKDKGIKVEVAKPLRPPAT